MVNIENTEVYGWESAIRGMRNPMNSWDKSDSKFNIDYSSTGMWFGANDLDLAKKLVKAGSDHAKFMRMIIVTADVTAPLYWWKEYDTYKVGTVANSCSTMHKIHEKEFTLDDFSCEQLTDNDTAVHGFTSYDVLNIIIHTLNYNRERFLETNDKKYWWQMIQLLPTSYNQRRTVLLNYAVLRNMYHARKNHKLNEWHWYCEWVKTLPYSELITND